MTYFIDSQKTSHYILNSLMYWSPELSNLINDYACTFKCIVSNLHFTDTFRCWGEFVWFSEFDYSTPTEWITFPLSTKCFDNTKLEVDVYCASIDEILCQRTERIDPTNICFPSRNQTVNPQHNMISKINFAEAKDGFFLCGSFILEQGSSKNKPKPPDTSVNYCARSRNKFFTLIVPNFHPVENKNIILRPVSCYRHDI